MSYYDHATAMAFKVGRWSEERPCSNVEREALACEQRALAKIGEKPSIYQRLLAALAIHRASGTPSWQTSDKS